MISQRDHDCIVQAATRISRAEYTAAIGRGYPQDFASCGAAAIACHLMVYAGLSCEDAARQFGISRSLVAKWLADSFDLCAQSDGMARWMAAHEAAMPRIGEDGNGGDASDETTGARQ